MSYAADAARKIYDIPRGDAANTLKQFVDQSGEQVVFLVEKVRGVTTNAVLGEMPARAALDLMLSGTDLYAVQDEKTGALIVNRTLTPAPTKPGSSTADRPSRAAPPLTATAAPPSIASEALTGESIQLPTFSIISERDESYIGREALSSTRTGVELADLPQSVVVLNRAFLNDINPTILAKALNYVGGAQTGTISWSVDRYMIRGFVGEGDYVDGFRTQTDKNTDINLVDHVEIIKGPSAIFVGNQANTVGGVINKISKSPTDYRIGSITVQVGEWDANRADIDVSGPITADKKLMYRLLVAGQDSKSYYHRTYERHYSILPMLGYRFSGDTEAWVKFETYSSHYSSYNGLFLDGRTKQIVDVPRDQNFGEDSPLNWRKDRFWRLWGQFTSRVNDHMAVRVAAFDSADYQSRVESIVAATGGSVSPSGVLTPQYVIPATYQPGEVINRGTTAIYPDYQPRREIQADAVFNFDSGKVAHKLLLGVDFIDYPETVKTYSSGPASTAASSPIDPFAPMFPGTVSVNFDQPPVNSIDRTQRFGKVFALETASLLDNRLILSLGGSRNRFDFAQTSRSYNQNTGVALPPAIVPEQRLYKNLAQFGIVVKPWPNVSVFYGYNRNFSSNGLAPNNTLLKAQEGRQHELGVKSNWFGQKLNVSVNYFDVRQLNNSVPAFPQTTPPSVALVAGTVSRGVDGDFTVTLSKKVDLVGSFALFDAHVPLPAPYNQAAQPYDGKVHGQIPVNNVSEQNVAFWTRYKFTDPWLKGLSVGVGVSHLGRRAITDNNNQVWYGYLPEQTLVDALVAYETGRWGCQLNIDNVLNRKYIYAARSNLILVPGTPLNLRASFTYKF